MAIRFGGGKIVADRMEAESCGGRLSMVQLHGCDHGGEVGLVLRIPLRDAR